MTQNLIAEGVVSIGFDGSQVEAGVAKTVKSIKTLSQAGKSAGSEGAKGIKSMADGANEASTKIDTATKRIARSIENAIATSKAGARGTSSFYEAIANVRGANLDVLRPYLDQLKQVEIESKKAGNATKTLSNNANQSAFGFNSLTGSIKSSILAYATFGSVTAVAKVADQYKLLNAQLKNSTGSQQEFNSAFSNVAGIAQRAQIDIADLATVYARLNNSLREFGTSQKDVSDLTETLSLALKVNGATTGETTSALLQLSQAFGKGKLDGDEFKTVMEAAPNVMRELAKSMNVPFGSLKDLAAQGQITSDVLLKAFTNPSFLSSLRKQAKGMKTLGGSVVSTKNEFLLLIGALDKATGSSTGVSALFEGINGYLSDMRKTIESGTWYEKLITVVSLGNGGASVGKAIAGAFKSDDPTGQSASGRIISKNEQLAEVQAKKLRQLQSVYNGLTDSIKLNSKEIEAQNLLQSNATKLFNEGIISQSDYDAIVRKSNETIKSLNGENRNRSAISKDIAANLALEHKGAFDLAKVNADLLKTAEDLTRPNETIIEQLQRQIEGYTGASKAVREYVQSQIDLATDADLSKVIDAETNARLDQIDAINQQAKELAIENENYGKLPSVITAVTITRLQEKKAMLEGLGLVVPELEAQISAYKRLQDQMLGKEYREAQEKRVELDKQANDEIIKQHKEMAKDINKSLTDALLRGFESGKSFAKNFRDTLVNMFKTLILRPAVEFLVSPLSGAISTALGGSLFSGSANAGVGSTGSIFQQVTDGLSSLNTNIVGSIEKLGSFLSTGSGGLGDTIGGYLGQNASTIAGALSFAPAVLSLLKGDIKSAAFQGAGAGIGLALGGPVGGAIGSFLGGAIGGLFGGGTSKLPRYYTTVSSSVKNGVLTNGKGVTGSDSKGVLPGTEAPLQQLNTAFAAALGGLLMSAGKQAEIAISSTIYKKNNSFGRFDFNVNGKATSFYNEGKSDVNATFQTLVNTVLTSVLVNAIQSSDLDSGIKKLFDGLADKTQISNMVIASVALYDAQQQLNDVYGLTVNQAAQVSKATGLAGDDLSSFALKLAQTVSGFKTIGDVLVEAKASLADNLGGDVPASLKDFNNVLKGIDKTTQAGIASFTEMFSLREQFSAFTQSLDAVKGGVKGALFSIMSDAEKQSILNADLATAFSDLGVAVPSSVQELIALGQSIDFTTKEGIDLAAVFPSLVTAFVQTKGAVDDLMNSLRDINEFKTLVDFNRYKGLATNYGNAFANNQQNVIASNSINTPINTTSIQPSNNTTISTSDPNLLEAIMSLRAEIALLKESADKTATQSKRAADVLVNVSPNGNAIQTEAVV